MQKYYKDGCNGVTVETTLGAYVIESKVQEAFW